MVNFKFFRTLLSFLAAGMLVFACGKMPGAKPRAFGREKEILVICDNDIWKNIEKAMRREIEAPLEAVRTETVFEIAQVEATVVSYYKEWDKLILIESLDAMHLLPDVVDDSTLNVLKSGRGLFFSQIDIWARGQRVVGIAAPTREELLPLVKLNGNKIYTAFLRQLEQEELQNMYVSGRDSTLADSLAAAFGFRFLLPDVYERTSADSLPENKLLFVHQDPVRSILITWFDNPGPLDTTQAGLAVLRRQATGDVYPGQETVEYRIKTSRVQANGVERLRVFGVWENRQEISGGIFIDQVIDSPTQHRRFYIDCLLFCPDPRLNKYRYMFQLDRIMDSFQIVAGAKPAT